MSTQEQLQVFFPFYQAASQALVGDGDGDALASYLTHYRQSELELASSVTDSDSLTAYSDLRDIFIAFSILDSVDENDRMYLLDTPYYQNLKLEVEEIYVYLQQDMDTSL